MLRTGTTVADYVRPGLEVFDFQLEPGEIVRIEGLATPSSRTGWHLEADQTPPGEPRGTYLAG
jgi:hypothetical protein